MLRPLIRPVQALAVMAALLLAAPALADPWPIKNFQVVETTADKIAEDTGGLFGDPFADGNYGDPADAGKRAQIEAFMRACADLYEAWGFAPPKLGRVVDLPNGEQAYRVYFVSARSASRYYPSAGGEGANAGHLRIDLAAGDDPGTLTFQRYATIAHELFHAVQYNSPFFGDDPSDVGDWITEGQAEAVGLDVARLVLGDDGGAAMEWGRRDYSNPLPVPERNPGGTGPPYETQSFWRYLAEINHLALTAGASVRPGIADPGNGVNYRYMADLLAAAPPPRDCATNGDRCANEIAWLQWGLATARDIQKPLRTVYGEFAVTIPAYGDPGGRAVGANAASVLGDDHWRTGVIYDCVKKIPDGPQRDYWSNLRFKGVSARCIVVPDMFKDEEEVFVEARATDTKLLDQIMFGVAGKPRDAAPMLDRAARERGDTTTVRRVKLSPDRDTVLVFANVAEAAEETDDQELEVILTTESGSLGVGESAASEIDFGEPLPIEFDRITARLIRIPSELQGEVYVGADPAGEYTGIPEPCYLTVTLNNTETREMAGVTMFTSGAITPGDYPFLLDPPDMTKPQEYPGQPLGGFMLGPNNMAQLEHRTAFEAVSGVLHVDSIAGDFMRASATLNGVVEKWDWETEQDVIEHAATIVVQFAADLTMQNFSPPSSDEFYACMAPE